MLILSFVTLAIGTVAKFNLTKGSKQTKELMETKENLLPFKAICSL